MMTQPIRNFVDLTSETSPATPHPTQSTVMSKPVLSYEDRRMFEMRARYARAEMVSEYIASAIIWVGQRFKRLSARMEAARKLRVAQYQLLRMSDRELSDLGLCRSDIHFAVRQGAEGIAPEIDHVVNPGTPANQNLRRVA